MQILSHWSAISVNKASFFLELLIVKQAEKVRAVLDRSGEWVHSGWALHLIREEQLLTVMKGHPWGRKYLQSHLPPQYRKHCSFPSKARTTFPEPYRRGPSGPGLSMGSLLCSYVEAHPISPNCLDLPVPKAWPLSGLRQIPLVSGERVGKSA